MALANSVLSSQFPLRLFARSNCADIIIRQPTFPMVKAVVMAMFDTCVFVIVILRSYAKMLWIDARRIVAGVHNYLSGRDSSDEIFVGISMGSDLSFAWHQKNSIAIGIGRSSPKPACGRFSYAPLKHIFMRQHREFIKRVIPGVPLVTRSAQFSANRISEPAAYALKFPAILIAHSLLLVTVGILAVIDGVGNVRI